MTTYDTPRVYVACLASYNAGRLHGAWIDATDVDEMREGITEMLKSSPVPGAEEYAIHDYDGFGGLALGEYEDLETVAKIGQALEEHGPAFAAFADNVGSDYATVDGFEEAFAGEWRSMAEYAEELADDIGAIDANASWPLSYIDWERAGRDLCVGGDYWTADAPGGLIYVFRSI